MVKLIILDRDGVINHESPEFIKTPDEWIPLPNSLVAIANLTAHGFTVVVCSNQSGIGRGLLTLETLNLIHQKMLQNVEATGGKISGIYFCPHVDADKCNCRKPKTQMISDALRDNNLTNATGVILVGDSHRDLVAIDKMGGIPVLVKTGNGIKTLDGELPSNTMIFEDLLDFSNWAIKNAK